MRFLQPKQEPFPMWQYRGDIGASRKHQRRMLRQRMDEFFKRGQYK
jgi:hypothetical protein